MSVSDIGFYVSVLRRRLHVLLATVVLLTGAGLAVAYLMPPVYTASARIVVEPPQIPADMARPTVQTNPLEQLQLIQQELTTREHMLELARRLDIYGKRIGELSEDDIVANLRSRISLEQVALDRSNGQGATVFSVGFSARQPELSARVVNALVEIILDRNRGLRAGKAGDTLDFFSKEVDRLGTELSQRDQAVLQFKNANKEALPDSLDYRRAQLGNHQERMLLLEREESALRVRRAYLARILDATGQVVGQGPVTPEQEMLRDLNRALAEQLSVFTPDSPGVTALRQRIASIQERIRADRAEPAAGGGPSETDMQLSDIDERLAFITREKTMIGQNIETLARTIDATPRNETDLNALERARDNIRAQYTAAVAKLAEASTGEQIELRAKAGRFAVVEPATPPQNPSSPNRKRLAAAGLAAGIVAGIGLVVLLELLNGSIRRPTDLVRKLQEEPLATIPYIWTPGEKAARTTRLAMASAAAVLVVAGAAMTVRQYKPTLSAAMDQVVTRLDPSRLM